MKPQGPWYIVIDFAETYPLEIFTEKDWADYEARRNTKLTGHSSGVVSIAPITQETQRNGKEEERPSCSCGG